MNFRCQQLSKTFDGVRAIDALDLELPSKGITAIIGPNGAGKTTLINCLTGFLRPDQGQSFLGKTEITHMPPHRIARLGVARTFQDLRLISNVSVLDNVLTACPGQRGEGLLHALLGFGVKREEVVNRKRALELLKFVELTEMVDDPAGELSYGQQKVLTLAVCLDRHWEDHG